MRADQENEHDYDFDYDYDYEHDIRNIGVIGGLVVEQAYIL